MRYYCISLLILLSIPAVVSAQEAETLFQGGVRHGGFGSLLFGVTSVNGEAAFLRGTRGAWILKFREGNTLHVGLGGYRSETGFSVENWTRTDVFNEPELETNYGGFELEYLNRSNELIHFGAQLLIGGGTIQYKENDIDVDKTSDGYFALQPGANIHLNVTHWFRISGGLFYRHAGDVNLVGTSNKGLSGFSAIIGLRFGKF